MRMHRITALLRNATSAGNDTVWANGRLLLGVMLAEATVRMADLATWSGAPIIRYPGRPDGMDGMDGLATPRRCMPLVKIPGCAVKVFDLRPARTSTRHPNDSKVGHRQRRRGID
jgi:hypothetical protein